MSDFLQRIQDRVKALRNAAGQEPRLLKKSSAVSRLGGIPAKWMAPSFSLSPLLISRLLTYVLMLISAATLTYWVMQIAQIPGPPTSPASGTNKGMTLYTNQDITQAYGLFGSKPIVTDTIYLRGVVVTSKRKDGALDGFAIFEIDGKPTNAISVGESLGKGLSLQSIGDESATLLYQGQKLDFKLSKPGKTKK